MIQKVKKVLNLISNMGFGYLFFRLYYAIITKLGWPYRTFPMQPKHLSFITLKQWRENTPPFFFYGKEIHHLPKQKSEDLKKTYNEIREGIVTFFSSLTFNLGTATNWITNPDTGYTYDIGKHWSQIHDFSEAAGDIKFVWEKARFSYLYDIIRYDYHFEEDQSEFVFSEISDFIAKNPINQGPNYKCSQEISIRVLNWTFALYYYKDSNRLTEEIFDTIMNAIYWQIHHIYHNIHFSRIAVRNNHAITETLTLYLSGKLFPFMPNTERWSKKAKLWFEKEIRYQIYNDGTFLQYSMNYHRVVVQLLTWAIRLAQLNDEVFSDDVYERAQKSLNFLDACSDPVTGALPNYGANDGALFFKLSNDDYRNYRSPLDDLRLVLRNHAYFTSESAYWYGIRPITIVPYRYPDEQNRFEKGGYYIIQEKNTKTFIRCGAYKDRPHQSDNLHLDIWVNGMNLLRDTGSYKYNTKKEYIHYFNGCEGHNTISVSKEDQMLKGRRFIWYYWVKNAEATLKKKDDIFEFNGSIKAFKQLGHHIKHHRKVRKHRTQLLWEIEDVVTNKGDRMLYQYWHLHPDYVDKIAIVSKDEQGKSLTPLLEEKWYSEYYGVKEKSIRLTFATQTNAFNTIIRIKL